MDSDSWIEAEVNFFRREKLCPRDYLDYLKSRAKSGDMENLNSLLKFWVWESGRKIDPATGVRNQDWDDSTIDLTELAVAMGSLLFPARDQ